ncbi:MAG: extracellular solute-binding protein, partial [Microthrixaceae bacterium]|nr:extracellular solute-binding protein [Microthrixaceae bacterium]
MKPHRSRLAIAALAASALLGTACGEGTTDTGTEAPSDGGVNASTLPDCPVGAFENETGSTKVVLWTSAVGATLATLRSIATDYNSSQNKVEVVVETQGIKYEELRKNFETGVSAKQLPAIVMGEDTWTQYMIDNGVTMPAQACINADDDERAHAYDDMLPGVTAAYTSSEVLWPGAFGASTVVLYFNKNHFTAAGLDPENPPTTYA